MKINLTGKKAVSRGTESSYNSSILAFNNWLKKSKIQPTYPPSRKYTMAYINYMVEMNLRPTTLNMFVSALRFVSQQKQAPIPDADYQAYLNAVGQYRRVLSERGEGEVCQKGAPLRPQEMGKLLTAIDESRHPNRERDSAAFSLMWGGALRPQECAHLEMDDVEIVGDEYMRVNIRRSKTDQEGRGQVINVMPNKLLWGVPGTIDRMREWLEHRDDFLKTRVRGRNPESTLLFGSNSRGWQFLACKHWREQTGIDFTLYSFRIGFITTMAEAGLAMPKLQKLARHKNPATTSQYYAGMDMHSAAKDAEAIAQEAKNGV